MKYLLFLSIAIFISGCIKTGPNRDYDPSPKSALANEISNKVFFQLKKEKDLYPCEWGGEG